MRRRRRSSSTTRATRAARTAPLLLPAERAPNRHYRIRRRARSSGVVPELIAPPVKVKAISINNVPPTVVIGTGQQRHRHSEPVARLGPRQPRSRFRTSAGSPRPAPRCPSVSRWRRLPGPAPRAALLGRFGPWALSPLRGIGHQRRRGHGNGRKPDKASGRAQAGSERGHFANGAEEGGTMMRRVAKLLLMCAQLFPSSPVGPSHDDKTSSCDNESNLL